MKSKPDKKEYNSNSAAVWSGIMDLRKSLRSPDVELLESDRLDGKTVLITGASSGLGLAASAAMAERGARVLMVCRREAAAERESVALAGAGSGGSAEVVRADMADFSTIRRLTDELKARGEKIDLFVSNAAVVPRMARKTADGHEEMLQVNALAPALFITLLAEKELLNTGSGTAPRIVVVASEAHRSADGLSLEKLKTWEDYGMGESTPRYGWTKLLLLTWVREFTRRNPGLSVHAMCPGPVASNIAREIPAPVRPFARLFFRIFFQSPGKAAEPLLFLAASQSIEGETGRYQFIMKNRRPSDAAMDRANGKAVWEAIGELIL